MRSAPVFVALALLLASPTSQAKDPAAVSSRGAAMRKYVPTDMRLELGVYGGALMPASNHGFFGTQWRPLAPVVSSLGFRLGFYPMRWVGLEIETGTFPGKLRDGSYFNALTLRGHALFQLPFRLSPFVLTGAGLMAVRTPNAVLGKDLDPAVYVGAGLKFYVRTWMAVRVEWRGTYTSGRDGPDAAAMHNEVLLGLAFSFGSRSRKQQQAPQDSDGDGFLDAIDRCVQTRGVTPDGCPSPDRDFDGVDNDDDSCPDRPGAGPDGCPPADLQPAAITAAPDPCSEDDDIDCTTVEDDDRCPGETETHNGFEDADGCADELPEFARMFTGAIEGIHYFSGRTAITPGSRRVLDRTARMLTQYPSLQIEIVAHTDIRGSRAFNRALSRGRAESVRDHLIDQGVAPERLTARGAGNDEPVADHASAGGRARNRRTELVIVAAAP